MALIYFILLGPKMNETILPKEEYMSATITGLKPYTTYQVNVSVVSHKKEGLPSNPKYLTTLEAGK